MSGFVDIDLALKILDWVLEQQLAGKKVNSFDVARHFEITVDEALRVHDELEAAGEFD